MPSLNECAIVAAQLVSGQTVSALLNIHQQTKPALGVIMPVLVLASAASIMSTDLYVPSLPYLTGFFATTPSAVQLTVSLNLLAFAFAQLLLGPLSDRYGRRPVMLAGLCAFVLFSIACALSQAIGQLIAARIAQGIAASVEAVVGLAIIRDLFNDTDRVRAMAIWGMAVAIAPAAAPVIGGYVHVHFGWQANFWLVSSIGVIASVMMWRVLPESTIRDPTALQPIPLIKSYWTLLRRRQFTGHALIVGASLGVIFAFITEGPFLIISHYGFKTEHFGFFQAAVVTAFGLGSLVADRFAARVKLDSLLHFGLLVSVVGACALPLMAAIDVLGAYKITAAMAALGFGLGPIFAVVPLRALDAARTRVGAASALLGMFQMGIGAMGSMFVTWLHDGTPVPFVLAVVGLTVLAVLGWAMTRPPSQ